ncbi:MAG: hypothetical protein AAF734_09840 [Bacteroidota bacterium]
MTQNEPKSQALSRYRPLAYAPSREASPTHFFTQLSGKHYLAPVELHYRKSERNGDLWVTTK